MRKLFLYTFALMWLGRLADPLVHSLAHDHHEHCQEQGVHLHEAEDPCQWSDPATLQSYFPAFGSELDQAFQTVQMAHPINEQALVSWQPDELCVDLRLPT